MASDKNALLALVASLYPDNTAGAITPAKLRQGLEEMISSDVNMQELTEQFILGALHNVLLKTGAVDPAYQEGLVFYDNVEKALSYYNEESDTKINCGQELVIKVRNDSGVTITSGQVVRVSGSTAGIPDVVLALADTIENGTTAGVATHDIPIGDTGYITRIGKLSGLDTSLWAEGDTLYVSGTVAGELTNVAPSITIPIAFVLTTDPVNGQIYTSTSRAKVPVALGQARTASPAVIQAVTTTPTPIEGFAATTFSINTTVNSPAQGTGNRAQFSPETAAFSGFYNLSGQASITGSANNVIFFEVYLNGSPTGLISVVDLSNNNIDFGATSLSAFTETPLTPSDIVEPYIYCNAGTSNVTFEGLSFSIERLGVS